MGEPRKEPRKEQPFLFVGQLRHVLSERFGKDLFHFLPK
jgi:hypothetical protein